MGDAAMSDPPSPTAVDATPEIVAGDEQHEVPIDVERWARLAADVLRAEGRRRGELTLTFVDRDEIAALNAEHMGVEGPTDVLAFPLDDEPPAGDDLVGPAPVLLGDVVICPSVAATQAPAHAGTLDDELALLTVHGVLHVVGHDHADPSEAAAMRSRERELLEAHHWRGEAPAGFRPDEPSS